MPKLTTELYFDGGQLFQQNLDLFDVDKATLARYAKAITEARLPLLASNVWIVLDSATGYKDDTSKRGRATGFAWPESRLNLTNNGHSADNMYLLGVPNELFRDRKSFDDLLARYSKVLHDSGVYKVHFQEKRPILNLSVSFSGKTYLANRKAVTPLKTLRARLGDAIAQSLWDERKKAEVACQARP